jgi:protein TonB
VAHRAPAPPPPREAPPPPNQEPPPKAAEAPPVFGVSMDSTVSGDGPGMAVPIGNTLMTKERARPKPTETVRPMAGDPNRLPSPVPEMMIAEPARTLREVKAAYPPEALRMGFEAKVEAKLLIDDKGDVRDVKILKPAGHGFDEAAREALKKTKFSPAKTADGKAVPVSIVYTYSFEVQQQ